MGFKRSLVRIQSPRPSVQGRGRRPGRVASWRTHARRGAVAWGVVAALEAVVAYLSIALPPERLSLVFAGSALVGVVAARLLATGPSAGVLLAATVWAGLNLVLGLWAMPVGAGL